MLVLPATARVIVDFLAAAEAAPEELSTIASVLPAPPMPFLPPNSTAGWSSWPGCATPGDAQAGERALAPFRALAEPLADMLSPCPMAGCSRPRLGTRTRPR